MARRKRYSASSQRDTTPATASARAGKNTGLRQLWQKLSQSHKVNERLKPHELTFLLRTLSTLVENGVPLPKALGTLAKDDTLTKHREVLNALRHKVESGIAFSDALGQFPHVCDPLTIHQIYVGEHSGTLPETLKHLSTNRDKSAQLRQTVLKKLAYPMLLVVFGSGLITFLLLFVVPVFQEAYDKAGVPLPMITQLLMAVGAAVKNYGWMLALGIILTAVTIKQLRKHAEIALRMDYALLRMPMFGNWLRNMAVLQLMEVLHNLMASGYTLAEALRETADSVGNRAVRKGVQDLQSAVQRGERFSHELESHEAIFPPIVNQLVIVGESTGQLTDATRDICDYLRREIERKTSLLVGAMEPVLTISLAIAVAVVLLAIYLPMFDMVNTVTT